MTSNDYVTSLCIYYIKLFIIILEFVLLIIFLNVFYKALHHVTWAAGSCISYLLHVLTASFFFLLLDLVSYCSI